MNKIQQIINKWDPIDLEAFAPSDEYISEVNQIQNMINTNKNITLEILAVEIDNIFICSFGQEIYNSDLKKCFEIAHEILNV